MGTELLTTMGLAFLGGVILNVMPCVLPVMTMKIFHMVKHGQQSPSSHRLHGLAYSAGIVATLMLLAVIVIGLRASGEVVGWGMQFQNPSFVAALTALIFVFGLNSLGVFEITLSFGGGAQKDGYLGSFINGVVAAIMSTPCSAPFLGTAAAVALASEAAWWQTQLLFFCIGMGLASPVLLISFIPVLARAMPRPGAWMETFKHLMGFTLIGAAIWLYGVLQNQLTTSGANWFLGFLLVLAVALWAVERFGGLGETRQRAALVRLSALALVVGAGFGMIDLSPPPRTSAVVALDQPVVVDGHINWIPYSEKGLADMALRSRPVFADFTADWCANCKANEKIFLETDAVRSTLQTTGILPMMADFTNEDDEIAAGLKKLGRTAVPAYVIYMPDGTFDLMPEAITTEMVVERLEAASRRFPPDQFR